MKVNTVTIEDKVNKDGAKQQACCTLKFEGDQDQVLVRKLAFRGVKGGILTGKMSAVSSGELKLGFAANSLVLGFNPIRVRVRRSLRV